MRLVSYNIQFGRGLDLRFDLDRIAAAVNGADVIALQEVERFAVRSGMTDQASELARRLPTERPPSPIDTNLDTAVITAPEARDPAMIARLGAVCGRILG